MRDGTGDRKDALRDSRIAGLEESVSDLFERSRDIGEKVDEAATLAGSTHQDMLEVGMKLTTMSVTIDVYERRIEETESSIRTFQERMGRIAEESSRTQNDIRELGKELMATRALHGDVETLQATYTFVEGFVQETAKRVEAIEREIGEIVTSDRSSDKRLRSEWKRETKPAGRRCGGRSTN